MNLDDKYDNFYGVYTLLNTTESKIEKNYSSFWDKNELSRINNLLSLPKITVTNMRDMFSGCKSLISIPDLSKWNTNNVKYMYRMFYECSSLISLPDLSKWNTNNVTRMEHMFYGCFNILIIPSISNSFI